MSTEAEDVWVLMDCEPLPNSHQSSLRIWWNPETGDVFGEDSARFRAFVKNVQIHQHTYPGLQRFDLDDPYVRPMEMAAILSTEFWVIPQPVPAAGVVPQKEADSARVQ